MGNHTEEIIIERPPNAENEPPSTDLGSIEELLIEEVAKREILYNFHLPISQRNRLAVSEEWQNISEALNGMMSIIYIYIYCQTLQYLPIS